MSLWKHAPRSDRIYFLASVGLLIISIMMVGLHDRTVTAAGEDEEFYRFVDVAAEIYSEISAKYVDDVKSREVLEGALAGMFRALDEHSQYMTPEMLQSLEKDTTGEFTGIGIHISLRQGLLTVILPIPGSPAAEAGLRPYDRIIEIEGESTQNMTLADAVERLTGPAGTQVTFKVFRFGERESLEFTIKRAHVEIQSVFTQMIEDHIGYARISRFSENTTRDLRRGLLEMKKDGMKGLVLDMRYNSGGLLPEAISVADLFVDKGEMIVSTKGRLASQNREVRAVKDPIVRVPVFVLVNSLTASASEIVAGAIQDHSLGVIIGPTGQNTFGKGSVQTIGKLNHTLADDDDGNPLEGAMRLTTAKYYTPSGRTIHKIGITPDIGVPITEKHERELERHGLFGDPYIGEDYHVEDEETAPEADEEGIEENWLEDNGGLQIQRNGEEESGEQIQEEADPDKPFYMVETPELKEEDDFIDLLLDEAVKLMKIYMILDEGKNEKSLPTLASRDAIDRLKTTATIE